MVLRFSLVGTDISRWGAVTGVGMLSLALAAEGKSDMVGGGGADLSIPPPNDWPGKILNGL